MKAIKASSLSKRFGNKQALFDVSLEVSTGKIFGFLGPNGAGKTTTIRCLMDYIRPDSGTIEILGHTTRRDSLDVRRAIGYLSSELQLNTKWTGQEHLALYEHIKGRSAKTAQLIERLNVDMHARVGRLSSGNQQKVAIVLAFAGNPKLLIMDEPTRGLDPLLQNELYAMLREFRNDGNTVFLSSHNLGEVQRLCDEVALIKDGRIMQQSSMATLRGLNIHIVTAAASEPIDSQRFLVMADVEILSASQHEIALKLKGKIAPVMHELGRYSLLDLEVVHASLEDLFIEEYAGSRND